MNQTITLVFKKYVLWLFKVNELKLILYQKCQKNFFEIENRINLTFKVFETLSSSPMSSSADLLSIKMLAKASKYLSRYCKEFESDRNLEENKTPSSFSDIYVPKCWVDLIFNTRVILDLFLFWNCKLQNCPENLESNHHLSSRKKLSYNSSQHSIWAHKFHFCMSNHDRHHIEFASFNQFHWIFRHKIPATFLRVFNNLFQKLNAMVFVIYKDLRTKFKGKPINELKIPSN